MRTTARWLFLTGVFIAVVWPRYFYISLAGRGVSGFTFITLVLMVYGLFLFIFIPAWQPVVIRGIRKTLLPLAATGAYYGWKLICDASGAAPEISLGLTFRDIVFTTSWLLIGAIYLSDERNYRVFPFVIISSALVATFAGFAEFVTGTPLLDLVGLSRFSAASADVLNAINSASSDFGNLRIKAVFSHPIVYGQVMAMLVPLAMTFVLNGSGRQRLTGMLLLPCIMISIFICQSRSPLVVLAIALGFFVGAYTLDIRRSGRMLMFIVFVSLAVASLPLLLDQAMSLMTGTSAREVASSAVRELQMERAGAALQYQPITGYGNGMAGQYAGVQGRHNATTVDSAYIVAAVDAGYVGLCLYITMLLTFTFHGLFLAMRESQSWERSLLASFAALIAGCAAGLSIIAIDDALVFVFLIIGYFIVYSGRKGMIKI